MYTDKKLLVHRPGSAKLHFILLVQASLLGLHISVSLCIALSCGIYSKNLSFIGSCSETHWFL